MKAVDGGKAFNITMRCTRELKERLELYHAANFSEISFNMFLGQMLKWQLDSQEATRGECTEIPVKRAIS
jgi:hypothetical protein